MNAVLFDLDGTLMDTAIDLTASINVLLKNRGKPALLPADMRHFVARGTHGIVSKAFDIDETHVDFANLKSEFLTTYQQLLTQQTQLFAGMEKVLDYLDANHIPWGIVTNKSTRFAQTLLDHFKLSPRLQCLVAGDTLPQQKPHPAPLQYACQLMHCDAHSVLYIGDSKDDFLAARAAGMKIFIAQYGYLQPDDDPVAWGVDGIIYQPTDIIELFCA